MEELLPYYYYVIDIKLLGLEYIYLRVIYCQSFDHLSIYYKFSESLKADILERESCIH